MLAEAGNRLTFAHQTYFEYRQATRLLDLVRRGGTTVAAWVRAGDQSLFRRDQLRLVLTLLRDEEPDEYVRTVRDLILAPAGDIRFHLRLLALRLLGELPHPTGPEHDLARELAGLPAWREHMFDQVFTRQPAWFEAMDDRGLEEWLASASEVHRRDALELCRWWSGRHGDRVARLLAPLLGRPDPWPRWVSAALPFGPAEDTSQLFALRLRLIRQGEFRHRHLMAQELAEKHPERLVELLEAHLVHRLVSPAASEPTPRDEREFPHYLHRHEAQHVERVAASLAEPFWDRLMPLLVRTCEQSREGPDPRRPASPFFEDATWTRERRRWSHDATVELLRIVARAGAAVAKKSPEGFAAKYAQYLTHPGLSVQYVVGLAFGDAGLGPADVADADLAIGWLCDNPRRLSLEDEQGHRWCLAQRILRRHAATCSASVYYRLEQTVLRYHDDDERRSVEWQLHCVRGNWPLQPNNIGLAQHALLPCLPVQRMTQAARSMMGVLERKYRQPAVDYRNSDLNRVRSYVDPIPADRAARISDGGWLQIIGNAARSTRRKVRDLGDQYFTERNAASYARQLGEQARLNPRRFASLALRVPAGSDPEYLSAILSGLHGTEPPGPDGVDWQPATDEQVTAVIEHVGYRREGEIGTGLCLLMYRRPESLSTLACRAVLRRYATEHPHPAAGWTLSAGEEDDPEAAAINCTRGLALLAVGRLLFSRPNLLSDFMPTLRQAAADPHPAVRVAAVEAFLPVLNVDRDLAVELFLSACEGDEIVLGTRRVWEFVRYAAWSHYHRLDPLLRRMAESGRPKVATAGTALITIGWLGDKVPAAAVEGYRTGSAAQRKGVATVLAHNCADPVLTTRCSELLKPLVVDPDGEVRGEAAQFLREPQVLRLAPARAVLERFVSTPGFEQHSLLLVEALRRHPESLIPLASVFAAICNRIVDNGPAAAREAGNRDHFDFDRFVPLILRLYEQAEQTRDRPIRNTCLDWWDRLLEARLGGARQLLAELDAEVRTVE